MSRLNDATPEEWDNIKKKVYYAGQEVEYKPRVFNDPITQEDLDALFANGNFKNEKGEDTYEEYLSASHRLAKEKQVAGDHYKKCPIQPIEYTIKNGLGFCEGNVIKYVTRYKDKGGKEDLLKAIHYIELLLEHYDD